MGTNSSQAVTNRFPQVGGNQLKRLQGSLSTPFKGRGRGNPSSYDSFQASLSPPVGRLGSFRKDWLTNKCSDNVLNINANGYVLLFISNQIGQSSTDSIRLQGPSKNKL